ncbi:MAG TPA: hypothetical protein VK131_01620 [Candidatus Acidoferrales bacterium]|nr:hypothetical protein [Candidatus Acidoferrales bacterium]
MAVDKEIYLRAWVRNQDAACTSACVLAALGALGARDLPDLGAASLALGAARAYGAPGLRDYVAWPGRRAQLDLHIEALARAHGLEVSSDSALALPGWPLRPRPGEALIVHLAWGQEAPGRYGAWGWNPLRPATYSTGGHSVVLVEVDGGWTTLDPNLPDLQAWPRPGLATARTRIHGLPYPIHRGRV